MASQSGEKSTPKQQLKASENVKLTRAAKYMRLYQRTCPSSKAEVTALVSEHDLKHGDVVAFSDYRDTDSHIVFSTDNDEVVLLQNPDDRAAGYLTIPKEVLESVEDAVSLYRDFIHPDQPAFNLHLSPRDVFVVERLGEVPPDWEIDVSWDWGEMDQISIKFPGVDEWECFYDPSAITRQVVNDAFKKHREECD